MTSDAEYHPTSKRAIRTSREGGLFSAMQALRAGQCWCDAIFKPPHFKPVTVETNGRNLRTSVTPSSDPALVNDDVGFWVSFITEAMTEKRAQTGRQRWHVNALTMDGCRPEADLVGRCIRLAALSYRLGWRMQIWSLSQNSFYKFRWRRHVPDDLVRTR